MLFRSVFVFEKGPIFANMVLADEINRATAKTQSAMLEAMAERTVTVAGTTHKLEEPFLVLATQNPIEQDGTYPLPEAQLDRFFFKSLVPFPDFESLSIIVERVLTNVTVEVESRITSTAILRIREMVRDVPLAQHVKDMTVKLVLATHPETKEAPQIIRKYVSCGASPRGLITLIHGAKARALVGGRLNVSIDDIRALAIPALRHRLLLNFEAEADGVGSDFIIQKLLEVIVV